YYFFFSSRRRHTRFSRDWSSDVCSSDLSHPPSGDLRPAPRGVLRAAVGRSSDFRTGGFPSPTSAASLAWAQCVFAGSFPVTAARSEERRVGKECRVRWSRDRSE